LNFGYVLFFFRFYLCCKTSTFPDSPFLPSCSPFSPFFPSLTPVAFGLSPYVAPPFLFTLTFFSFTHLSSFPPRPIFFSLVSFRPVPWLCLRRLESFFLCWQPLLLSGLSLPFVSFWELFRPSPFIVCIWFCSSPLPIFCHGSSIRISFSPSFLVFSSPHALFGISHSLFSFRFLVLAPVGFSCLWSIRPFLPPFFSLPFLVLFPRWFPPCVSTALP